MASLYVGAAKACINPTSEMMPFPSFSKEPYTDIFSNCNMRVIVMDNGISQAAIIGFDMAGVPEPEKLKKRIESVTGIRSDHIMLTATHNHTGCDISFSCDREDQRKIEEYRDYVCNITVRNVKEALANKRHARYGYGEGKSYINGNRDMYTEMGTFTQGYEPEGYCDRTVSVMKFIDDDGKLIAAIVNYGMHATLGYFEVDVDGQTKISGNVTGIAEEYAEERFGEGSVILWTSAAAGDQNPQLYCLRDYDKDGFPYMARTIPGLQYNLIKIIGKQHGVDICKTINNIHTYNQNLPIHFGEKVIALPAQTFPENIDMQWVNDITNHIYPMKPGEMLPEPIDDPDHPVLLYLQEAILGDVALVGVAAEIYALIGKACKEVSPYKKTMVITHVERSLGYIIDKTSVEHKCFEQFGRIKAGVCDERIVEGVRELFDEMMQ